MFFSKEQIEQSVKRLQELNPFFGTVFLAFKQAELPVGTTRAIDFSQVVGNMLQKYYRPVSGYAGFYLPFETEYREINKGWVKESYVSDLLRGTLSTFSRIFIHERDQKDWGWQPDYIETIEKRHLPESFIPTFDLAVWLFRATSWDSSTQVDDVVEAFFTEFHITGKDQLLFDASSPSLSTQWLQIKPVTNEEILDIIGHPPKNLVEIPFEREAGATLELLKMRGIGPTQELECEFAPRLNLITGDNGLGKTFLLECAWWALTGNWVSYQPYPHENVAKDFPRITFQTGRKHRLDRIQSVKYNWDRLAWDTPENRFILPGLSIFAQADGSFAVWDPAKHLLQDEGRKVRSLINFSRANIWDGLDDNRDGQTISICNGLIQDWVTWQSLNRERFDEFSAVLKQLSPDPTQELLLPGQPTRLPLDARYIPTLEFSYGKVPIVLCSAGIRRIIALAYLLVWAWNEHLETSKLMRREPGRSIVLLIDEMEAHLHPFWQRVITPALMNVVKALDREVETQLIVATHSPLVLASVEPSFDEDEDKLFHLQLENGSVHLDEVPFITRGRVDLWLMSNIFGLKHPRSKEAEEAIEKAKSLQRQKSPIKEEVQQVSEALSRLLAPDDQFWPRWTYFAEREGVEL